MSTAIKTKDDNIFRYLQGLNASIPNYQRSYEWGKDQLEDFLEDIYGEVEADASHDSGYFFGPIITTEDSSNGEKQIIDGQQRLTTTTIFLAVLRDILGQFSGKDADYTRITIIQQLIGDGSEYFEYKLNQTGEIEHYFREKIQRYDEESPVEKKPLFSGPKAKGKGKINNLIRSYNYIFDYVSEKIVQFETDKQKVYHLKKVLNTFTKNFFIVEISAPDRTEAFQIFQTVNARGLDLSAADLIKSDFFGNSGDFTDDVIDKWNHMQSVLGDSKLTDFIRYVWNSKYKFTSNRALYKQVSRHINQPKAIYDFMIMLDHLSKPYAEIQGDSESTYLADQKDGQDLLDIIEELNNLKFKTYKPIYLAMINQKYRVSNMILIMSAVSELLIKNKIVSQSTNWAEKFLAEQAKAINRNDSDELTTTKEVVKNLKNKVPSDDSLRAIMNSEDFANKKNINIMRFILRTLENNQPGEKGLLPIDNGKIHLEHIMPQKPKSLTDWSVDETALLENLWKLGNLTLWLGRRNSSRKNTNFHEKCEDYKNSDLLITRDLATYNRWTPKEIQLRTKMIIDEFLRLYR